MARVLPREARRREEQQPERPEGLAVLFQGLFALQLQHRVQLR